jgi:hypothetical protein
MVAAVAGAGYYFGMTSPFSNKRHQIIHRPELTSRFSSPGRAPTKATDESPVEIAKSGMPWEAEGGKGKYSYHPGGDTRNAPKDAPSAINVVVVPDVNLPKVSPVFDPGLLGEGEYSCCCTARIFVWIEEG